MIYGDINRLISSIERLKNDAINKVKEELNKQKQELKKEAENELVRRKTELIRSMRMVLNRRQRKILFEYEVKSLEFKESVKNDLVKELTNQVMKKINNACKRRTKFYQDFIKGLIIKSVKALGGNEFSVQLGINDSWVKSKLRKLGNYKIRFLKPGGFKNGVIVYNNNMKELIDNTFEERLRIFKEQLYKLVDKELIWG